MPDTDGGHAGNLTILGASARAAAFSARRAGFVPYAGDLFADADLQACCPSARVPDYPAGMADVLASAPDGPWMYTGAVENHPQLVDQLARIRPLYGNPGAVLRRVRNPALFAQACAARDIACPAVELDAHNVPTDGSWLRKSRRSAGGAQVTVWRGAAAAENLHAMPARKPATRPRESYFQQLLRGTACSAVYVAVNGRCRLVAASEQLLGGPAGPYQYRGSIGPWTLGSALAAQFDRVGQFVAAEFDLLGLFGVDFVLVGDVPWPVEVNPRFTASAEIIERALGISLVGWHVDACRDRRLPAQVPGPGGQLWGKAIVYARQDALFGPAASDAIARLNAESGSWPALADIPTTGSRIVAGQPVLTVFASGPDRDAVHAALELRAAAVDELLRLEAI